MDSTPWLEDDIFSIDSSSLFRPETSIFPSNSTDKNVCSLSSEYYDAVIPNDHTVMDGGYMSSNSSDSGKHSPNGSEGNGEQESYWVFPSNDNTNAARKDRITYNEDVNQVYTPITPVTTANYVVKALTPTQIPESNKLVYIVPSPKNTRNSLTPVKPAVSTPTLATALPISTTTIYVKTEQPAVYVQSDGATPPLYICQNTMEPSSISSPSMAVFSEITEEDLTLKKLEDRKARNRAAAQASRIRKQNEIQELRNTVYSLRQENASLREENEKLRQRLSRYERVCEDNSPNRKRIAVAGTIMMALYMIVTVSPVGFGSTPNKPIAHAATVKSNVPGRVLSAELIPSSVANSTNSNCVNKRIYNSTEAIRLNSDLYEWVDRHEAMGLGLKGKRRLLHKKQKEWISSVGSMRVNVTETEVDQNSTIADVKPIASKRDRIWRQLDMLSLTGGSSRERREKLRKFAKSDKQSSSVYNKKIYEKLTAAIQQKDDTLYVLALEDYFLLPALERNVTSQPKITLILPSLSFNSTITGKINLMAIDLRVTGCRSFQLSRQLLPLS